MSTEYVLYYSTLIIRIIMATLSLSGFVVWGYLLFKCKSRLFGVSVAATTYFGLSFAFYAILLIDFQLPLIVLNMMSNVIRLHIMIFLISLGIMRWTRKFR